MYRKGNTDDYEKRVGPSKSKQINTGGYIRLYFPEHPNADSTGNLLEHRYVMSEHLGRPLYDHEVVHHINGNRSDNRIDNLELWSKAQPAGQRVADKISDSIKFLQQYGYKVTKDD